MKTIAIVEDNKFFAEKIKNILKKHLLFIENIEIIPNYKELKKSKDYELYIVDFVLPDAEGEQIDFLLKKNKEIILLTNFEKKFLQSQYKNKVIDYITKNDLVSINYLVKFIKRLYKNHYLNVLIVDDDKIVRKILNSYLSQIHLNIFEASNGKEALEKIKKYNFNLIITDINMPEINGEQFVSEVRKNFSLEELPIVSVSGINDKDVLVKMLKLGVNDYMFKPFSKEEIIVRINNILDMYESYKQIKKEAQIDSLTGVYNRYFLEHTLEAIYNTYDKKSLAMLDIDFFKKINDTYGHQYGDEVLKNFAKIIKNNIRSSDIVIRYGGEEFLIFMPNTSKKEALIVMLKIKKALQKSKFKYTFSAGISEEGETLAESIKIADDRLYKAKESGRNKIVIE